MALRHLRVTVVVVVVMMTMMLVMVMSDSFVFLWMQGSGDALPCYGADPVSPALNRSDCLERIGDRRRGLKVAGM